MLGNLSLLAWTQGQILEAHVGFATRSTVSGPLLKSLWSSPAAENISFRGREIELKWRSLFIRLPTNLFKRWFSKNDNENKYKKHLKNSMASLRVTPKMKNPLQPHKISKRYWKHIKKIIGDSFLKHARDPGPGSPGAWNFAPKRA